MNLTTNILIIFAFLQQTAVVTAFPSGAGACPEGIAAVGGAHINAITETTGSLADGGFEVLLDGFPLVEGFVEFLSVDQEYTLELIGGTFKGFLFRLGRGLNELDTFGALSTTSSLAQVATVCGTIGGITHNSRADKTSMAVGLMTDDIGFNLPLDVTVVVENAAGISTYYYTQFLFDSDMIITLPSYDPSTSPSMFPTTNPSAAAPSSSFSASPTMSPTSPSAVAPSSPSSISPSTEPSTNPSAPAPSSSFSASPTMSPTNPTISISPSTEPSTFPTTEPTISPTTMAPVAPTPAPAPREVSIRNPNFERDNNAWKVTEGTAMRECGAGNEKNGDCNIAFTGSVERQRIKQRLRDIEGASEGTVFKLKFWVMAEDLMTKGDFKVYLKLKRLDGSTSTSTCKSSEKGTFEYTKMKCKFTADKFVEKATLIFQYSSTEGALYLDKISMTEG